MGLISIDLGKNILYSNKMNEILSLLISDMNFVNEKNLSI